MEYQTFSDPKELQPFFDAAKDKIVSIKPGETKQLGPYSVKIDTQSSNERGTDYEITADNGQDLGVTLCGTPDQITPLLIDMGENHPYMKGQMLAFANYVEVRLIYFDKKSNKYQKATVSLEEGKIRPVPTNVGLEMLKDGGFSIFTAPKRLLTGDVVGRADGNPDGSLGYLFFKFVGPSEPGLIAANK